MFSYLWPSSPNHTLRCIVVWLLTTQAAACTLVTTNTRTISKPSNVVSVTALLKTVYMLSSGLAESNTLYAYAVF